MEGQNKSFDLLLCNYINIYNKENFINYYFFFMALYLLLKDL